MPNLESLKAEYLGIFERLIDLAISGKRPRFLFCDEACLELFVGEDGVLHWGVVNGGDSGQ